MKHPHQHHRGSHEHSGRERAFLPAEDTDYDDDLGASDLEDELEDELNHPDVLEDDDDLPIVEEQRQHPGS